MISNILFLSNSLLLLMTQRRLVIKKIEASLPRYSARRVRVERYCMHPDPESDLVTWAGRCTGLFPHRYNAAKSATCLHPVVHPVSKAGHCSKCLNTLSFDFLLWHLSLIFFLRNTCFSPWLNKLNRATTKDNFHQNDFRYIFFNLNHKHKTVAKIKNSLQNWQNDFDSRKEPSPQKKQDH